MLPSHREDRLYQTGKKNEIDLEEKIMFGFLKGVQPGSRILDVGCGEGSITSELEQRGFKTVGVDFSEVGINLAQKKGLNAKQIDVDRDGLPFEDASFDVVWMGDILEHVFDPVNLMKEARRVLKSGGSLLLTTPNDFNLYNRIRIFLSGQSIQSGVYQKKLQSKHHTFFSWDLLLFMIKTSGFDIEEYRSILISPRYGWNRVSTSLLLGRLFGRIFIVKLSKNKS